MEKDTITISLEEYRGMKETIEILQDQDMISQILESEANIQEGNIKEFSI